MKSEIAALIFILSILFSAQIETIISTDKITFKPNEEMPKNEEISEKLFIYTLQLNNEYKDDSKWTEEVFKSLEGHSKFLDDLGKEGLLVFAGRTMYEPENENLFGIAILKAESLDKARKILENDPGVTNGIQKASVHPFSMGIRYFENLPN